jgi:hypothetical protein
MRFRSRLCAGKKIVAFTVFAAALVAAGMPAVPATAAGLGDQVREVTINAWPPSGRSVLALRFDSPISRREADQITQRLRADRLIQPTTTRADYLSCEGSLTRTDNNGRFDLAFTCFSNYGTMPWGFKLSPAVRAIVVGAVTEDGLRWWRGGAAQPKNAAHVAPPDYHFHGTMKPVYKHNHVDYQDYLKFRHNVGPGGTASVTFAGGVDTLP